MATYWSDMCNRKTAVYRCYTSAGELLYVGMSKSPEGRFAKHGCTKPWWRLVDRITLEWFPDRQSALDAEASAIWHEHPVHNIVRRRLECC